MTKDQLLAKLQGVPGNMEIILSSDEEGNDFHSLIAVDTDTYYSKEDNNVCSKEEAKDYDDSYKPCVVLWP